MGNFFKSVFLLVGVTIGAGMFSLPFSFLKSGVLIGIFWLVVLWLVTYAINIFYSEIILKTRGDHQFPGYVEKYLGEKWKKTGAAILLATNLGALLSYLILGGDFLATILHQSRGPFFNFFFFFLAVFIFLGELKLITKVNDYLTAALVFLIFFLIFWGVNFWQFPNVSLLGNFFFAYGPILYSLAGYSVIPEMEEVLRQEKEKKKLLKKAVFWGTFIPFVVYLIFSLGILALTGAKTTPEAITGLSSISPGLGFLAALIGLLAILTSLIALCFVTKEVFYRDFSLPSFASYFLVMAIPPFLFILGFSNFVEVISLTGSVTIGLLGILISLIWLRLKKKTCLPAGRKNWHKLLAGGLIYIFLLGIILEFLFLRGGF